MSPIKKDIIQSIKIIALALILSAGISYVSAGWMGPSDPPPNGNVQGPINAGHDPQNKMGVLGVGNLVTFGDIVVNGNRIRDVREPIEDTDVATKSYVEKFVPDPISCGERATLQVVNGRWTCVGGLQESCRVILEKGQSVGDGLYKVAFGGAIYDVYCDMTTDGGGWMLVMNGEVSNTASSVFKYNSSVYSGSTEGNPGSTVYMSPFWVNTPPFTQMMFKEVFDGIPKTYIEGTAYSGNLKDWNKGSGTIKLNQSRGRVYNHFSDHIVCNRGYAGQHWEYGDDFPAGFGSIRVCHGSSGTVYYGLSHKISKASLWIR